MRRLRSRGPSSADLIRQTRVRRLLSKYGAYSRQLVSRSAASELESSSCLTSSTRSSRLASSSSALQLASSSALAAASRRGHVLHEDDDLKLTLTRPSQLVVNRGGAEMDKGLALAAAQYVSRVLGEGEVCGVDSQRLKEDFLHLLERDWGFAGADNLTLGRVRITIKRRDNELENIRRRAEMERAALEKSRLEERMQSRRVQAVSSSSSQQVSSSSSTQVVKTRVVKTTKRTVQTVRAA